MANNNRGIKEIKTQNLSWLCVVNPGKKETDDLHEKFNFHPLDLRDCLPPLQRSKLVERPDYLFMILLFPVYDRKTREILPSEIDFFVSQNNLTVVHDGTLPPLSELFESCQNSEEERQKYLSGSPAILLYEILNRLLLYCAPMLNHVSLDIDEIEQQIFAGYEKKMVKKILMMKRNIVNFRKTMQAHENIIKKLIHKSERFFSTAKLHVYFDDLVEQSKDIWDSLGNYNEAINALHQTNESLISFRLNDIMKILTIISVTMLPATLIASIFGMNATNMPVIEHPLSFWIILGIMTVVCLLMIRYFKKKDWL